MAVKYRPAPVIPVCANFGGFYIGGHVGWNYHKHDWKDLDNYGFGAFALDHAGDGTNTRSRWHAGVQGGYNWQNKLLGVRRAGGLELDELQRG